MDNFHRLGRELGMVLFDEEDLGRFIDVINSFPDSPIADAVIMEGYCRITKKMMVIIFKTEEDTEDECALLVCDLDENERVVSHRFSTGDASRMLYNVKETKMQNILHQMISE